MLFNSLVFLFVFLPVTLLLVYGLPKKTWNVSLLVLSLLFYAWGGVSYAVLLLISILANYFFGKAIGATGEKKQKRLLAAGITVNLALLCYFKYANFFVDNFNDLLERSSNPVLSWKQVVLPIGISFFTFQAISYLVDVYRGETASQKNVVKLGLFISMFPQLVAGPIVRYKSIEEQLNKRTIGRQKLASGINRFIIGLAKKVMLADTFALTADQVFALPAHELSFAMAWTGIILYSLQIYYDFSGYSDMAIGLGRMIGFELPENFNFPYIARSVKEFWRRWHMTLSSWFKDYLYIPLGGNRKSNLFTYRNLIIVFFLTGLWHGANWNFVFWGLFHGFFLVLERLGLEKVLARIPAFFRHFYTIFIVVMAWVLFRTPDLPTALNFYGKLFDLASVNQYWHEVLLLYNNQLVVCLLIGLVGASPLIKFIWEIVDGSGKTIAVEVSLQGLKSLIYITLFFISVLFIVSATHHPFIYFQF